MKSKDAFKPAALGEAAAEDVNSPSWGKENHSPTAAYPMMQLTPRPSTQQGEVASSLPMTPAASNFGTSHNLSREKESELVAAFRGDMATLIAGQAELARSLRSWMGQQEDVLESLKANMASLEYGRQYAGAAFARSNLRGSGSRVGFCPSEKSVDTVATKHTALAERDLRVPSPSARSVAENLDFPPRPSKFAGPRARRESRVVPQPLAETAEAGVRRNSLQSRSSRKTHTNDSFPRLQSAGTSFTQEGSDAAREEPSTLVLGRWESLVASVIENPPMRRWSSPEIDWESDLATWKLFPLWSFRSDHRKVAFAAELMSQGSESFRETSRITRSMDETRAGDILRSNRWLQNMVIHPHSTRRQVWTLLGMFFILFDVIVLPLQVFFYKHPVAGTLAVSLMGSAYWLLDLPVQFLTGYQVGGVMEMRPHKTARAYFKTWFGLDFVIVLVDVTGSLGELSMNAQPMNISHLNRTARLVLKIFRWLRVVNLLRVRTVPQTVELGMMRISSEVVILVVTLFQYTAIILLCNHYVACAWYAIADLHEDPEAMTWLKNYAHDINASHWDLYAMAYHWSLTQFTPATQDITPSNGRERLFACCVVVFALMAFSQFLSGVTNAVNQLRNLNIGHVRDSARMREFLHSRSVSTVICGRVLQFMQENYHRRKRRVQEEDIQFFADIPLSIRMALHEELYMPVLRQSPTFGSFVGVDRGMLINICHLALSEASHLPQEDVFLQGWEGCYTYLIVKGEMEYQCPYVRSINGVTTVEAGEWLSEIALWVTWRYCGHLAAKTSCEIVRLECYKLHSLLAAAGGPLLHCLRVLAVFVLGHIENEIEQHRPVTDLSLGSDTVQSMAQRSRQFWSVQADRRRGGGLLAQRTFNPESAMISAAAELRQHGLTQESLVSNRASQASSTGHATTGRASQM